MLPSSDEYAKILYQFFTFGNLEPDRSLKNLREDRELRSSDECSAYYAFCDSLIKNPATMKSCISAILKNQDVIPSERQRAIIVFINFFAKPLTIARLTLHMREFLSNHPHLYPRDTIPPECARYTNTTDELCQLLELFFTNARIAGQTHILNAGYIEINNKFVEPPHAHSLYSRFSQNPIDPDDCITFYTATPKHIFLLSLNEYIECS